MKLPLIAIWFAALCQFAAADKTIPNYAIADLVLGKPDFTMANSGVKSASTMYNPSAITIDPITGKLFVAEENNFRVLRFSNYQSLTDGAKAEAVFGQPDFSTAVAGSGATGFGHIRGIFFDQHGQLWVADGGHNRVVMFEAASSRSSFPTADRVYGQPDFTTYESGTTATKMKNPYGVFVDTADRLWVADSINDRVLRFDSISTKPSGAAADGVIGQFNFLSSPSIGSGSSETRFPTDITVSANGTLFVASPTGNRILRFDNAANLEDGAGASAVLGQPDFFTTSAGTSATQFDTPFGLHLTADDSLWVSDFYNNRVVCFFNASSKPTGSAADRVVGQPNFTTNISAMTNRNLDRPYMSLFVDPEGNLWVPDSYHNRVLRFPPDVTKPRLAATGPVPSKVTFSKLNIKGTASDTYGISKVYYRIGSGEWKLARGTTSWKFTAILASGRNKISIYAVDSVGNRSATKVCYVKR
ncbi:MAG: NHL repeat-containing protein [Luteolibacter sp.]|uniref:NHL repeat-containing protein n=1 Tax=Luteolibacter sp. TaxID=1962973 RepID=UPI003264F84C